MATSVEQPEQWVVDVRYLAKLADWAAGEGFCQLKNMDDPDEWCFAKWNELAPESNGGDYFADALATALIASIQRAFAEREAELVGAIKWSGEVAPPVDQNGCVTVDMTLEQFNAMRTLAGFRALKSREAGHG